MQIENNYQFETFDGELMHPSLDIKDGVLALGFRYRTKPQEEKDIVVVAYNNEVQITETESLKINDKLYCFEIRGRKLIRIDTRWSISELKQFLNEYSEAKREIPKP